MRLKPAIAMCDEMNEKPNGLTYAVGRRASRSPKELRRSPYFVYVERGPQPPRGVMRITQITFA